MATSPALARPDTFTPTELEADMMSLKYVRPYVMAHKNDDRDAEFRFDMQTERAIHFCRKGTGTLVQRRNPVRRASLAAWNDTFGLHAATIRGASGCRSNWQQRVAKMVMANTGEPGSAGGLGDELKQDAARLGDVARDRLSSEAEAQKGEIASQARSVSNALGQAAGELGGQDTPDWLRSSLRQGADTLQRLADSVENKNPRELLNDLNALGREHPSAFLGACALAGFAVARVFKAGSAGGGAHNSLGLTSGQGSASTSPVGVSQAGAWPAAQDGGQAAHRSSQPFSEETATADEAMAAAISLGAQ